MYRIFSAVVLVFALTTTSWGYRAPIVPIFTHISGDIREVTIEQGDTLFAISARHGESVKNIMRENAVKDPRRIKSGDTLKINTRRVIPSSTDNGLVADIAAGTLYRFDGGQLISRYPAGFGTKVRPTPIGTFIILFVEQNDGWEYPSGVDEEREREGVITLTRTPPEPPNTLGPTWIQLSTWGFGIHATPFPSTIGSYMSYQHIRVGKDDIDELAESVGSGLSIEAIYHPARLALPPDGSIWLEAHPDIYSLGMPTTDDVIKALGARAREADRDAIERVLLEATGIAEKIGISTDEMENGIEETSIADDSASWRCLDCPPGEDRRVTLQLEAETEVTLFGSFPLEVLNASGQVVYASTSNGDTITLKRGATRNFVWDIIDSNSQPLPPGQYTVKIFFKPLEGPKSNLSLPIWVDR